MGIEQMQFRAAVVHDVGCKIEDQLETARRKVEQARGAKGVLTVTKQAVEGVLPHVDKARDGGEFEPERFDSALAVAALVKKWVLRTIEGVNGMALRAELEMQQALGEVRGLEAAVASLKKLHDDEQGRVQAIQKGLLDGTIVLEDGQPVMVADRDADGRPAARPTGVHPGNPVADLRARVEAEAAKADANAMAGMEAKPKRNGARRRKRSGSDT